MKHSDEIDKIVPAFIKAQSEMKSIKKEAFNPHFRSKYADLSPILEATIPALNSNGIALVQALDMLEGGDPVLVTTLLHESTQWIGSTIPVYVRDRSNPQALGSAVTYAKRYALQALVGLATHDEDDDDGNAGNAGDAGAFKDKKVQQKTNRPKGNESNRGGDTQKKFQEAKDKLLDKVEKLRETVESSMTDIEFLEAVSRKTIKKTRPANIDDVRKLWAAILTDSAFDLATGDKLP